MSSYQGESDVAPWYRRHSKPLAAAGVATIYAGVSSWAYFAWFRGADRSDWYFDDNHWFGRNVYAGGADKLGHLWATYVLARGTTAVLKKGGWTPRVSSIAGSSLALFFFTMSEIEDGYVVGFEINDEIANAAGAALALLMVNVPAVDRLLDFRVEYVPTSEYLDSLAESGNVDVAQDYSGQSYMLALHLGELPKLTEPRWMGWARYVDLVAGFETRNYVPAPADEMLVPRQSLYLGVAIDMQEVLARLLPESTGRSIGNGVFEVLSVPYTTLRLVNASRSP